MENTQQRPSLMEQFCGKRNSTLEAIGLTAIAAGPFQNIATRHTGSDFVGNALGILFSIALGATANYCLNRAASRSGTAPTR
jgi:hypothetical protein